MPTTSPFPVNILNKLKARSQSSRWTMMLKETREFRAYCCNIDSDSIMGVAKEPVIVASFTPNPICVGANMSWDISSSYAPGSTLTGWTVDFGDLSSTSGSDFPNDTISGTHSYASAGTYTIVVNITEGLGLTQESSYEIIVVDCGELIGTELWSYASTDGEGVFFIDWTDADPQWEDKNMGLEDNALFVRSLAMTPSSRVRPPQTHELWAATLGGIFKTIDGGTTWGEVILSEPSNVEFADGTPATLDELDFHKVIFDPTDESTVYILASKDL